MTKRNNDNDNNNVMCNEKRNDILSNDININVY